MMQEIAEVMLIRYQIEQKWTIERRTIAPEAIYYKANSHEFLDRLLSTPILEFRADHFRDGRKLSLTDFGLTFKIAKREWDLLWASLKTTQRSPRKESFSYIFHDRPHEHVDAHENQLMDEENSQEDICLRTNPCDAFGNTLLHKYRNGELFLKDIVKDRELPYYHEENLVVHRKIIKLLEEYEERKKDPNFREVRCVAPDSS